VILCWVSSHKGIAGNKVADQLAKNALGSRPEYSVPYTDFQLDSKHGVQRIGSRIRL